MAIELIRESFKVEEKVGKNDIQTILEQEVYLSASKPDIEKVLWAQGKVDILNTKLIQDKLIINGLAKFNLLYKAQTETEEIHLLDLNKEFKEEIDIFGANEEMLSKVQSKIEYIEWEAEERKVVLKALVSLSGEVEEIRNISAIKGITNGDKFETLKEEIKYKEVFGREISYALVKDTLNLGEAESEIDEVLGLNLSVKEIETMAVEDRVITSAEVNYNLIYSGGNRIYSKKGNIPFNHFIEMVGADKDLIGEAEFEVVEGSYEVMGNDLGERKSVDLEIKVRVLGKAYEEKSRELIIDCYSTMENILLEREQLSIKESLKDISHIEKLNFEVPDIYTQDIIEILGTANLLEKKYVDDSIVVDGYLTVEVLYIDRLTNELGVYKDDFPFRSDIDEVISYDTDFDVEVKLDNIDGFPKKDSLEIEGNIRVIVNINKERTIYAIKEIKETGELINKKDAPSISIYIAQKDDSMWDIAKRYYTTIDEIITSNNLTQGEISPGDKIIIEKKLDSISI